MCIRDRFVIASIVAVVYEPAVFAWLAALLVAPATVIFVMAKTPKELILVLKLTSMAALVYALLVLVGFAVQ
jgi:1,4-dihydroxy-2-naphthoate octaprenyltransferase